MFAPAHRASGYVKDESSVAINRWPSSLTNSHGFANLWLRIGLDRTVDTFQDSVLPTPPIAQRSWLQVKRSEGIMSTTPGQKAAPPTKGDGAFRLQWLVAAAALGLILGGATAWYSMRQSLWIDELHTAWVSTGPWQQVVQRSAAGNQTPIYFAWQWWLGRTFGHSELCLRATSLVAWLGSLSLFAAVIGQFVRHTAHAGLWWLICLIALDRQQIFFATEARPYMLMSAVVLLGWVVLDYWLAQEKVGIRMLVAWQTWIACCAVAVWLQPTAVLFVASQFALAMWRGGSRRAVQALLAVALFTLVGIAWPMRYVLEPAWQGRQAWAAFAADLHWVNILKQFPILVVGVPGLIAAVIGVLQGRRRVSLEDREVRDKQRFERSASARLTYDLWLCGWAMPLLMVVLLTASGVAPLMHARYLYAATLPLTLWTACMLGRLRSGRSVAVIVWGMILLQAVQQGSLSTWLSGHLPVVERGEQWREAVAHTQLAHTQPYELKHASVPPGSSPIQIYCAANLIEGGRAEFLRGSQLRYEYLSLPLRTLYPVADGTQIVPLLNDPRTWPDVISSPPGTDATRWLLVRASKAGLAKRLQLSDLRPIEQFDFGAVQLVRF